MIDFWCWTVGALITVVAQNCRAGIFAGDFNIPYRCISNLQKQLVETMMVEGTCAVNTRGSGKV